MADQRRFPKAVYGSGDEPDARFSLANERTYLAWITAGLALLSVGVGLDSFALTLNPFYRHAASLLFVAMGVACPVQAWFGWMKVERALRRHRPLPSSTLAVMLTVGCAIAGLLVFLGVVLS